MPATTLPPHTEARLSPAAALAIKGAVRLAKGREVCFSGTLDEHGTVASVRVVARGDVSSVLALRGFAERGEMLIHNHPSGLLEPSDADLQVAARLHDDGIGFGICDNDGSELYVVVEVPRPREVVLVDPERVSADLGPGGAVSQAMGRYEDRPSQRALATAITELYNHGGVGLLEAGTGVGKSMGYLVPALRWAAANEERTVVSTNTINLQEQLVRKDLPFLAQALTDQTVRFALLKGWRNYLCLARLEQAKDAGATLFDEGLRTEMESLVAWAARTTDGSLSDLPAPPRQELWDEVAAEPDVCTRAKCSAYDKCFLFKARREAAQADVIVVNHHLLLADVAVRRTTQNWEDAAVLPSYSRLVVDEGHHLEDAAAAHLGSAVTRRGLARLFNRLERRGKGLLTTLVMRLASKDDLMSTASLDLVHARLEPSVHAAREKSSLLFDLLDTMLMEEGVPMLRLTDDFSSHPVWRGGLSRALEDALGEIELLRDGLQLVRGRLEENRQQDESVFPLLNEMRSVMRRLQAAGDALRATLAPEAGSQTVRWVEVKGRDRAVSVACVPLDLAPILRDDLFKRLETTIVTSATLSTQAPGMPGIVHDQGGAPSFRFLAQRLGLDAEPLLPRTASFPSPFRYGEQAILAVPSEIAAPNVEPAAHFQQLIRVVLDVVAASDGGIFVLFTSHRDVRQMAAELRARDTVRRWPLLVHGEETRDTLLARFRDAGCAVLLGTASFWEGVDVPGDALRGLVIAKLPFRVPTEPITAAHCEAIERRGGNAFADYMLPHASLRLKQGFGRLIRTATDRGIVVIADPRIVSKRYGRELMDALPPARRVIGRWASLSREITSFYAREEGQALD